MNGMQFLNYFKNLLYEYKSTLFGIHELRNCLSSTRKGRTKRPLNADVPLYLQGTVSLVNNSWDAEAVMN